MGFYFLLDFHNILVEIIKYIYCFLMNWFLLSLPLFVCLFTHKISSKQYLNLTFCVQASVDHTDQRAEAIPCSTATPNWTVHVSDIRTVKVSNISLITSKQDIEEFFSFSGDIQYIEMQRSDHLQCTYLYKFLLIFIMLTFILNVTLWL